MKRVYIIFFSIAEPQAKKPRIVRHTDFLDSDEEDESEPNRPLATTGGRVTTSGESGTRYFRKLALDSSSSESDSETDSGSGDGEESSNNASGVNNDQMSSEDQVQQNDQVDEMQMSSADHVDLDQNVNNILHSPVMDTVDLMGTCTSDLQNQADTKLQSPVMNTVDLMGTVDQDISSRDTVNTDTDLNHDSDIPDMQMEMTEP